jgi:NAD-dependent DNA ligase
MENFNHLAKTLLSTVESARREGKPALLTEDHCKAITESLSSTGNETMALDLVPHAGNDRKSVCLLTPMKATHIVDNETQAATFLRQFWIMCTGTAHGRLELATGIILQPNIEGVALTLRYDSAGLLALACTRGDGIIGVDVTAHILAGIAAGTLRIPLMVPSSFADDGSLEIRGVLYCHVEDFAGLFSSSARAVNFTLQSPLEDPNALPFYFCAMEIKSLVSSYLLSQICTCRTRLMEYLKFIGFEVPEYKYLPVPVEDIFRDLFFDPDDEDSSEQSGSELEKQIKYGAQTLEEELAKKKLPYAVDGLIVAADAIGQHVHAYLCNEWTSSSTVGPNPYSAVKMWADFQTHDVHKVLLKRKMGAVTAIVEEVVWEHVNFNNHFTLSAVAKICPVSIAGMTIDRAVLGSISRIESLTVQSDDLGMVNSPDLLHLGMNPSYPVSKGATVNVELSTHQGLVPIVHSVVKAGEESLTVPVACPYCNAEIDTSKLQGEKGDYALKIVHEQNCVVRESQTISLVLNRLRRLNLSPYFVHTLFSLGHLPNGLSSMFLLTVDKLISVPGVQQATAQTIVNCLDTKNNPIPWDALVKTLIMTADWINSVEYTEFTFPLHLDSFKTFKAFETAHKNLDREKLATVVDTLPSFLQPGGGEVIAIDAVQVLSAVDKHTNYAIDVVNKMLKGKVNVITKTQSELAKNKFRLKDTPLAGKKVRLYEFSHYSNGTADIGLFVRKLGGCVVTKGDADIHLFNRHRCRSWHRLAPEKEKYLLCDFLDKFAL